LTLSSKLISNDFPFTSVSNEPIGLSSKVNGVMLIKKLVEIVAVYAPLIVATNVYPLFISPVAFPVIVPVL
jgi:hypothetical protein